MSVILMMLFSSSSANQLPNFTQLVKDHSPAVVNISTTYKLKGRGDSEAGTYGKGGYGDIFPDLLGRGGEPESAETSSLGSGFILSKDGYIVTNYHVITEADQIIVRLNDRREFIAELVGSDLRSDIALLKVKATDLPVLTTGESEALEVGEWVIAIGSPYGFDHSVTAGIVSAKERSLPTESYVPFIQTDVAINPGNSGGPLFNIKGEVVGINSQIYSRTGGSVGLSFAIPIDVVMDVVGQLKDHKKVSRGWLGVRIQEVTRELAKAFKLNNIKGALVNEVFEHGPADKVLKDGDIIIEFDGKTVTTVSSLPVIVGKTKVGSIVDILVLREGKEKRLKLTLEELSETASSKIEKEVKQVKKEEKIVLGMVISDLDDAIRKTSKVKKGGVWVQKVKPGMAADSGIIANDIIIKISGKLVKNAKHLLLLTKSFSRGDSIAVLVNRDGSPRFIVFSIKK